MPVVLVFRVTPPAAASNAPSAGPVLGKPGSHHPAVEDGDYGISQVPREPDAHLPSSQTPAEPCSPSQ